MFTPLSNLYSNALLGSLNARDWFREHEGSSGLVTIPLTQTSNTSSVRTTSAPSRHSLLDTVGESSCTGIAVSESLSQEQLIGMGRKRPQPLSVQVQTDVEKVTL